MELKIITWKDEMKCTIGKILEYLKKKNSENHENNPFIQKPKIFPKFKVKIKIYETKLLQTKKEQQKCN